MNEIDCIKHVLEELAEFTNGEILIVDGNSSDGTPALVKELGFKVLTQDGKGYGDAMKTGVKHSNGDIIITFDADGSYDPKDISHLVEGIDDDNDVVFSSRYLPQSGSHDDTFIRYIGNMLFTFLLNIIHGVGISDSLFLYIAAKKEVFELINMQSTGFEYCIEFPIKVKKLGFKYKEIPSFERERLAGESTVNAFSDGLRILWYLIKLKFKD